MACSLEAVAHGFPVAAEPGNAKAFSFSETHGLISYYGGSPSAARHAVHQPAEMSVRKTVSSEKKRFFARKSSIALLGSRQRKCRLVLEGRRLSGRSQFVGTRNSRISSGNFAGIYFDLHRAAWSIDATAEAFRLIYFK